MQLWTPDWGSLVGLLPGFQDKAPAKSLHYLSYDRKVCCDTVNMRAGVAEPLLARRHVRAVDTCRIGRKECVCKFSNAPTYIVCFCIDQRYIRTQPTSPRPCQQCFLVVLSHVHASWRMWAEGVGVALSRLIWRVGLTGLFTLTGVQLMQYHVSWP